MTNKTTAPATTTPPLYSRVREILESARSNIARTVNTTQVIANWLIGREIVEEEQQGKKRAGYGTELLADLAARLKADFGSGYGVDNLELFRRFYLEYPRLLPEQISDQARRNFDALPIAFQMQQPDPNTPTTPGQLSPCLSWTHWGGGLVVGRSRHTDEEY